MDHPWGGPDGHLGSDESDSSDEPEDERAEAGKVLMEFLLSLLHGGILSAKTVCIICWWAWKAGALGVQALSFRPEAPTGHYQRHIDRVMGVRLKSEKRYRLMMPRYNKAMASRSSEEVPVNCCHEVLHCEVEQNPAILRTVADGIDQNRWSELYRLQWAGQKILICEAPTPLPMEGQEGGSKARVDVPNAFSQIALSTLARVENWGVPWAAVEGFAY